MQLQITCSRNHCPKSSQVIHVRIGNAGESIMGVDLSIRDVRPPGSTTAYASPEVLVSLQKQSEGVPDYEPGVLINGSAADMWALACVLYKMLTGALPFMPTEEPTGAAPLTVLGKEAQQLWLMYRAVWHVQKEWVSASCSSSAQAICHPSKYVPQTWANALQPMHKFTVCSCRVWHSTQFTQP